MPTMRSETQTVEALPISSDHQFHVEPNNENRIQTPKISLYELSREERIKENLQRMQQLGLKDLSNSLLNSTSQSRGRGRPIRGSKSTATPSPPILPPSGPVRRSSRLQNATPVSYSEVVLTKKDELLVDVDLELKGTEVYTEKHEKLLGNTERSWTLFVDGCGSDGKRIYDPVKGKTCHQCRSDSLSYFMCKKLLVIVLTVANATWSKDSSVEIVYI
ncbi:hypothetical protein COLO4_11322 [Corchorus olitorius]|uniref:Uncharacterized protein n=1 Tax=Corchorus olitorius TaxID=93759 RepID=A0A1R3K564_9ROSI|nr:hypothetical protein COLO4_11322 [Corchorus olitorius]